LSLRTNGLVFPRADGTPPSTAPALLADDDIGGLAVHIAARISSLAAAGEVLVSSTVRDLIVGSGQALTDRGEHELKGVPGPWRIFAVHT
jgi:class 3 adenylate cyclase